MRDPNIKAEQAETEIKEEKRILATNAWHLARFLIEHDHETEIPPSINAGQFLNWCEKYPMLREDDKIIFINQYAELEKLAKNVTARTLVATRIHGHGFFHAALNTSVGRYLIFLFLLTFYFAGYLLIGIIEPDATHDKLVPFAAAGLGTCVYLLRVTQEKLKTRTFDPAYLPSQFIRLVLGTLAGGTIVLFPVFYKNSIDIGFTQGLVAFVLGYAVDIYYALLDNIGGKIKNTVG
jgi:hypothetical protein